MAEHILTTGYFDAKIGGRKMDASELKEILKNHKLWLSGEGGERADFSNRDFSNSNLSNSDLRHCDLSNSDLSNSDLRNSDLRYSDLNNSDLRGCNLNNSDLRGCNLNNSDLSGAKGLLSPTDFMADNFERTEDGYIAYKIFNGTYASPADWKIERGSVISENANFDRCTECGCGINVAPLDWVKRKYPNKEIWKVLIRWEWLPGVCVPYMTDGKIRCEKVELLEVCDG